MALDIGALFKDARTYNAYEDRAVPVETLRALYDHAKWGPTAANTCPARFVFVTSADARRRLSQCVNEGNVAKVLSAPVTAIIAADSQFYDEMPKLFPSRDFRAVFADKGDANADLLDRNVALQGAYLIVAARALGLDCGPMSGFDKAMLDAEFFPEGRWKSNFLCCLGYGRQDSLHPRNPRLSFEEACRVL